MTNLNEIYKCAVCGNIVEVVHASAGQLVCCGQSMKLLKENTAEASKEKHIPLIERSENEVLVKVGSIPHPMEEKHYIEWIELLTSDNVYRKYLKPNDEPEAVFKTNEEIICVREHCNIHGLWKATE